MTVGELMTALVGQNVEAVVVMSLDETGVNIREMEGFFPAAIDPETGAIGLAALDNKAKLAGFTKDDVVSNGVPAIVLMPYGDEAEEEGDEG